MSHGRPLWSDTSPFQASSLEIRPRVLEQARVHLVPVSAIRRSPRLCRVWHFTWERAADTRPRRTPRTRICRVTELRNVVVILLTFVMYRNLSTTLVRNKRL